jgi:putative ABC transport system permease protein
MMRMAFKELLRKWRWSLTFALNLGLGFIGFISILSYRQAIEKNIETNSKAVLAADLSISARKTIPEDVLLKVDQVLTEFKFVNFQRSKVVELFAMMQKGTKSQLVTVKAVDDLYPLYGEIQLSEKVIKSSDSKSIKNTHLGLSRIKRSS